MATEVFFSSTVEAVKTQEDLELSVFAVEYAFAQQGTSALIAIRATDCQGPENRD